MFIGHFALGFAAKKLVPKRNLAWLMVAPLWLDIVFPPLVLLDIEQMHVEVGNTAVMPMSLDHMPWSHSLVMTVVWSLLFAAVVFGVTKDKRGAWLCAALVASHWVLDVIAHRPDMPLVPGVDTKLGLGLWYSIPATLAVESVLWAAGLYLYFTSTKPTAKPGARGPVILAVIVTLSYLGSIFGPPPSSAKGFAAMIFSALLIVPFVWRFDKHRAPAAEAAK